MTKKDYIQLAILISDNTISKTRQADKRVYVQWDDKNAERFLQGLFDMLKANNPRFNEQRFLEAITGEGEGLELWNSMGYQKG